MQKFPIAVTRIYPIAKFPIAVTRIYPVAKNSNCIYEDISYCKNCSLFKDTHLQKLQIAVARMYPIAKTTDLIIWILELKSQEYNFTEIVTAHEDMKLTVRGISCFEMLKWYHTLPPVVWPPGFWQ